MFARLTLPVATVTALVVVAAAPAATSHDLRADANLKTTSGKSLEFTQKGGVRTSLGNGSMTLHSKIRKGHVDATFTVRINGASVHGSASGKVDVKKSITYTGTAKITSGTGRYKHARADGLKYTGTAPLNGKSAQIHLSGTVRY